MYLQERVDRPQRQAAVDLLSEALAEGYLDSGEYQGRVLAVRAAVVAGDIAQQMADLPARFRWYPGPTATTGPAQARSVAGDSTTDATPAPGPGVTESEVNNHPLAVVTLALGALSLPTSLCLGTGALLGIAAVLLGARVLRAGRSRMVRGDREHLFLLLGMVLGALGILAAAGMFGIYFFAKPVPPS